MEENLERRRVLKITKNKRIEKIAVLKIRLIYNVDEYHRIRRRKQRWREEREDAYQINEQ